jgi:hypothetical protein
LQPYLAPDRIRAALDARAYVGDAPERALTLARVIRQTPATREQGQEP